MLIWVREQLFRLSLTGTFNKEEAVSALEIKALLSAESRSP